MQSSAANKTGVSHPSHQSLEIITEEGVERLYESEQIVYSEHYSSVTHMNTQLLGVTWTISNHPNPKKDGNVIMKSHSYLRSYSQFLASGKKESVFFRDAPPRSCPAFFKK